MITDIKPVGVTAGVEIRLSAHSGIEWLIQSYKNNIYGLNKTNRILLYTPNENDYTTIMVNSPGGLVRRENSTFNNLVGSEEVVKIYRLMPTQSVGWKYSPLNKQYSWASIRAGELDLSSYQRLMNVDARVTPEVLLLRELILAKENPEFILNKFNSISIRATSFLKQDKFERSTVYIYNGDYLDGRGNPWDDFTDDELEDIISDAAILTDAEKIDPKNGTVVKHYHEERHYIKIDGVVHLLDKQQAIEKGCVYLETMRLLYVPPSMKVLASLEIPQRIGMMELNLYIENDDDLLDLFPRSIVVDVPTQGRLDFDLVNEVIGDHKGIVFIKIGDTLQHFINDRDYINLESAVLLVNEHLQYLEDIMP